MLTVEDIRQNLVYDHITGYLQHAKAKHGKVKPKVGPTKEPRTVKVGGITISSHRAAWVVYYGVFPSGEIDHINGDPSDNRIANLRDVSKSINQQNKRRPRADNKSGYLGVSWSIPAKKWKAQITIDGHTHYLGLHSTPEQAHAAYLEAKRARHPGCTI